MTEHVEGQLDIEDAIREKLRRDGEVIVHNGKVIDGGDLIYDDHGRLVAINVELTEVDFEANRRQMLSKMLDKHGGKYSWINARAAAIGIVSGRRNAKGRNRELFTMVEGGTHSASALHHPRWPPNRAEEAIRNAVAANVRRDILELRGSKHDPR